MHVKAEGVFLEWKAQEDIDASTSTANGREAEWTMVPDAVSYKNDKTNQSFAGELFI